MQIHDRMIFQLCFAYDFNTPILANSAAFYLIPVSLSENDALVTSLMVLADFFVFFSFLQSLVFNRSPNSLIILGCVVQFESQKLGIVLFLSLSICPSICQPALLALSLPLTLILFMFITLFHTLKKIHCLYLVYQPYL